MDATDKDLDLMIFTPPAVDRNNGHAGHAEQQGDSQTAKTTGKQPGRKPWWSGRLWRRQQC